MRTATAVLAAAALGLWASAAGAAPIAAGSEISVNGEDNFSAVQLTFLESGNLGGGTGSFSILAPCDDCVAFPLGSVHAGSSGELWSVTDGSLSSTLTIHSDTTYTIGADGGLPNAIAGGTGELTLSGFDTTPGTWEITSQGPEGARVTWSASAVAEGGGQPIPEPTSLILLGSGLLAAGLARRSRKRAA